MESDLRAEVSDDEWADPYQWEWLDGTITLVALLLMKHTLFKSGYSAEVITEIDTRLNRLIKKYTDTKGSRP